MREAPERLPTMLESLSSEGLAELHRLMTSLLERGADVLQVDTLQGLRLWSERLYYHLRNMREEMELLVPWRLPLESPPTLLVKAAPDSALGEAWRAALDALPAAPELRDIPDICHEGRDRVEHLLSLLGDERSSQGSETLRRLAEAPGTAEAPGMAEAPQMAEARTWCRNLMEELDQSRQRSRSLLIGIRGLADYAETLGDEMDFQFLFDPQREVFYLGYRVDTEQLDTNHYDLLASEARTASLIAIAKGDVPQSHWLHLARPLAEISGAQALLSWNGSMFEYLHARSVLPLV